MEATGSVSPTHSGRRHSQALPTALTAVTGGADATPHTTGRSASSVWWRLAVASLVVVAIVIAGFESQSGSSALMFTEQLRTVDARAAKESARDGRLSAAHWQAGAAAAGAAGAARDSTDASGAASDPLVVPSPASLSAPPSTLTAAATATNSSGQQRPLGLSGPAALAALAQPPSEADAPACFRASDWKRLQTHGPAVKWELPSEAVIHELVATDHWSEQWIDPTVSHMEVPPVVDADTGNAAVPPWKLWGYRTCPLVVPHMQWSTCFKPEVLGTGPKPNASDLSSAVTSREQWARAWRAALAKVTGDGCVLADFSQGPAHIAALLTAHSGRYLYLLGDSLMGQLFNSLACPFLAAGLASAVYWPDMTDPMHKYWMPLTESTDLAAQLAAEAHNGPKAELGDHSLRTQLGSNALCVRLKHGGGVCYMRQDGGYQLGDTLNHLRPVLRQQDIVMGSTGGHFPELKDMGKFQASIEGFVRAVGVIRGINTVTQALAPTFLWLDESPSHSTQRGDYEADATSQCYDRADGHFNRSKAAAAEDPRSVVRQRLSIATDAMVEGDIPVLAVYDVSMRHSEFHIGHKLKFRDGGNPDSLDCLHWCTPGVPDTWLHLLLSMLLSDKLRARVADVPKHSSPDATQAVSIADAHWQQVVGLVASGARQSWWPGGHLLDGKGTARHPTVRRPAPAFPVGTPQDDVGGSVGTIGAGSHDGAGDESDNGALSTGSGVLVAWLVVCRDCFDGVYWCQYRTRVGPGDSSVVVPTDMEADPCVLCESLCKYLIAVKVSFAVQ